MLFISSFGLNELSCQSLVENLWNLDFSKYNKNELVTFCNVLYTEYKAIRELYLNETNKQFIDLYNLRHPNGAICPLCHEYIKPKDLDLFNEIHCCSRCASH